MLTETLTFLKDKLLHGPHKGETPLPQNKAAATPAAYPPSDLPNMEFGEAQDVRPSEVRRDLDSQEQTTREWIRDQIQIQPEEPKATLPKKVASFCGFNQQIDYLEGSQDLVQNGLEINLEHWADIIDRLTKNKPVQVQEALEAACAIDYILTYAPEAFWRETRKENRSNIAALQKAKSQSMNVEGDAKEACMRGVFHMQQELEAHKEMFDDARTAISKGEDPDFDTSTLGEVKRMNKRTLEEAWERHQRKPRNETLPPAASTQANQRQMKASRSL